MTKIINRFYFLQVEICVFMVFIVCAVSVHCYSAKIEPEFIQPLKTLFPSTS